MAAIDSYIERRKKQHQQNQKKQQSQYEAYRQLGLDSVIGSPEQANRQQWLDEQENKRQMAALEQSVLTQTGGVVPNLTGGIGGMNAPLVMSKGPKQTVSTPLDTYRRELDSIGSGLTSMTMTGPSAMMYTPVTADESRRALDTFQTIDDFYRELSSGNIGTTMVGVNLSSNRRPHDINTTIQAVQGKLNDIMTNGNAVERELARDYSALFNAQQYKPGLGRVGAFGSGVASGLATYIPELTGGLSAAIGDVAKGSEAWKDWQRTNIADAWAAFSGDVSDEEYQQYRNNVSVSDRGMYSSGYKNLDVYFHDHPDTLAALQSGKPVWTDDIKAATGVNDQVLRSYLDSTKAENLLRQGLEFAAGNYGVKQSDVESWYNQGVQLGRQIPGLAMSAGTTGGGDGGLLGTIMSGGTLGTAAKTALQGNLATYLIGTISAASSYSKNIREHDYSVANYANALAQGFIEYFTEGLFGFSDMPSFERALTNPVGGSASRIFKALIAYLESGLEEGAEEVANVPLSAVVDWLTGYSTGNTDRFLADPRIYTEEVTGAKALFDVGGIFDVREMWKSGVDGAIGGLLMGSAATVIAAAQSVAEGADIREAIQAINREAYRSLPEQYRPQPIMPNTARREDILPYRNQVLDAIRKYRDNVVILQRNGQNIDVTGIDITPTQNTSQGNTEAVQPMPVLNLVPTESGASVESVTNNTIEDAMFQYGDQLSKEAKLIAAEAWKNYQNLHPNTRVTAQQFVNEFTQAYTYGKGGATLETAKAGYNGELLTDATLEAAYKAGQAAANGTTTAPETTPAAETVETEAPDTSVVEEFAQNFQNPERVMEIYRQNPGADTVEFTEGFTQAYDRGQSGLSESYLRDISGLTDAQKRAAFQMGREDANVSANTRAADIAKRQKSGNLRYTEGTVKGVGVTIADLKKTFNDPQNVIYRALTKYAQATGVNIVLYRSQPDANGDYTAANGRFEWKDDTIYIDLNAGLDNIIDANDFTQYVGLRTFAHEFTHFIEKWNPKGYNEFRQFVFRTMEQNGRNVNDMIESVMAQDDNLTYEKASREVVADGMSDVLTDSDLVRQLAEEQPNIFRRLLARLRDFVARLKQYYRGLKQSNAETKALMQAGKYMDGIVDMWDQIAREAVHSYQGAVSQVYIDQPAKPDNLPKYRPRPAVQQQTEQAETQQEQTTEPVTETVPVAETEPVAEEVQEQPVQEAPASEPQTVTESKEAARLRSRLNAEDSVDMNGYHYEITGMRSIELNVRDGKSSSGSYYIGTIQRYVGKRYPVLDGNYLLYRQFDTRQEAVDYLVDVAVNNKLLEEREDVTNGTTETEAPTVVAGGETNADRNGDRTVRVPVPVQEGDVPGDAGGREPAEVPTKRRRKTGRNVKQSDTADRTPGGTGNDESGVQPGLGEHDVTPETSEEQEKQAEELHEETVQQTEQQSTEAAGGNNYQIGDSLDLPKGEKARYKANVEAIRLVKQLETEGRNATAEEQAVLARYVGWGGIPNAFDERKPDWSQEYAELKELLTEEEYNAAKGSTLNAHYTSIPVIRAMYRGLDKLGFNGGRMLEPSSGVGNFVGAMPADMSAKVKSWTMVELDDITGLIAKYLYPQNDVRIEGFEKAILPDNYMDVAISNVPFGNYPVVDRAYPKKITSAIHNYFFAKSLDKVRPGGIVMFITSSFTMNSNDDTVRKYIAKKADLLGAIRLPNTAFSGNAGTSVVTDILVLKKRPDGTEYSGVPFIEAPYDYKLGYQNEYFKAHPDMVLGEEVTSRGMYSRNEYTVNPYTDRGSLESQIDKAFKNIDGQMDYPVKPTPEQSTRRAQRAERGTKEGGFVQKDGKLYQNNNGELIEVQTDEKTEKRIKGMLTIRDFARALLNAQQRGEDAKTIKTLRTNLNKAYDTFVKVNGYLNSPANKKAFSDDPDRYSLYALEIWDSEKKTATKADIFTTDTVKPVETITHADTLKDAVAICRNTIGSIDVQVISNLTGKSQQDVTRELIESELAYKDLDGHLEPAETYLSGNVRAKLRDAQGLVGIDKDYQHNIDALKRIVPEDISHDQIFVQPGTPWIPTSVYSDFAADILGGNNHHSWRVPDVVVHRSNQTGTYTIDLNNARLKNSSRNNQEWGTNRRTFLNLFEAIMNSRSVTVTDRDDLGHTYVDQVATAAANEMVEKITKRFQEWLWEDEERTKDLEYLYNETYNNLVTPKYDGSTLTVNGLRAGWSLRPHQANAVQRIVTSGGNTLLAHRVGAGKTFEMAAAAMKLKELGIVNKPMFAVPKSLVAQWGKEFSTYFPAAKLLVAEQNDFTPGNRKTFANRIATGNYDAIIVSYEQFEKIPISNGFAKKLYQEQIDEIIMAINDAKEESGKNSMSVKDMEKKRKQLEAKIAKLSDTAQDTDNIEFEQLGIDSIFIDEAHNFKNLFYTTSMNNISGLGNKDGSQRAFDLFTKVRYLQQLNGGRGVVFATATPVMNSMSEMYIMQKYLQYDLLKQLGLTTFDAWAKQFGEIVKGIEIKPSGQGYRIKESFSRFKNLNELQLMFRNFTDVLTAVPGLKIPKMKGGSVKIVECGMSEFQKKYVQELADRADNVKNVSPKVDNMLKITSDGRKVSLTQRLIDPSLPYEENGKIYKAAENILAEYKGSKNIKGTQLVFMDMATPKGKSNNAKTTDDVDTDMDIESAQLYVDLKRRLVNLGIPAKEIAFIHDADNDAKKKKLSEDVNSGRVRVLIGSTAKMGVGLNVQERAVAIHHLDAPRRPGDVEQRDGRVFRQGNINDEVSKYVYITKGDNTYGSFDARLWDTIDRKNKFIGQIMNGENVGREAEDVGEVTLSAAEIKAVASGSPLIMEQVQLQTDINKLENLYMAWRSRVRIAQASLQDKIQTKAQAERSAKYAIADSKHRTADSMDDTFSITIGNKTFKDKKDAGKALMVQAIAKAKPEGYTKIGTFAGFDIMVMKTSEGILGLMKADGANRFNLYPDNTTLMITNMQKVLNGLEASAKYYEALAQEAEKDIASLEQIINSGFEYQDELDQKRKRYNEVMDILNPKEEQKLSSDDDDTVQYSRRIRQEYSSAATSLNQVAALFKSKYFVPGAVNIDIGGGAYNATTEYLADRYGTENLVFDPYNRGSDENRATLNFLRAGNRADTATCANVLNVIREPESRRNVILEVAKSIKEDGTAYFSVYEKDKSGQGRQTGTDQWQNSRATADYVSEIEEFFDDVERKGGVIIARNPKANLPSAVWLVDKNSDEEIEYSTRRPSISDREVLRLAANELDVDGLTDGEKDALRIFNERLERLEDAQEKRNELGQQYREENFTKGGSKAAAAKILSDMKIWDTKIKALETSVLSIENKDVLKAVLQKARRVVEREQARIGEEKLKAYRARRNESVAVQKYREQVRALADTFRKWLMHPSNKNVVQHVPAELQKTVVDFLDSINFLSKRALNTSGLDTTKADRKYLRDMKALRDAIQHNVESQGLYSGYNDLPEGFIEEFQEMIENTQDYIDSNDGVFVVNQMSSEELRRLYETLKTLRKFITNINEFHNNAMFEHAYEAGGNTIGELTPLHTSTRSGKAYNFMRFNYMRPSLAFEHFGKGGMSIEHEFREGQATMAFLTKKVDDFAKQTFNTKDNPNETKNWRNAVHTFTLENGEEIRLTETQIMSLYMLNKRNQALSHIYGDGIRAANFKEGRKVNLDVKHKVTKNDIANIIGTLSDRQIEVADALQNYMSTDLSEMGNYVSMARFDVEQFTEKNYFPINVDGRYLPATADEMPGNAELYALLNMGFSKETKPNASNALILYDVFDVFANHAASMIQYRSFALPILDALKWFNYSDNSTSVREQLSRAFGAPEEKRAGSGSKGYAESFVLNLLRAYNGTAPQGGFYESMGRAGLHRFNRAAVAYNLRVVVQQPLAITRAATLLPPGKLAAGLGMSVVQMRKLAEEMEAHSGIALWKRFGFYDTNISIGLNELIKQEKTFSEKVTEVGMKGAEVADRFTWAAIWYAAKSTINRADYDTEQDYWDAVTEKFEDVIYKTQVVDSVLTKSDFLRDNSFLARTLGSFMSEPSATVSMLADAYYKYTDDLQRGMSRSEAWQKNSRNIMRTMAVYAIGQAILAAIQSFIDAWRDDDDYEKYHEKYWEAFKRNLTDEIIPFAKIPILSDFWELLKKVGDKAGWWDKLGLDLYGNNLSSGWLEYADYLYKAVEIFADKRGGKNTNYTEWGWIYNLIRASAGATGFPAATGTREVIDAWNNTVGALAPSKKIKTYKLPESSNIKYAYLDGYLTEEEAMQELIDKGEAKDRNEAFWTVRKWDGDDKYSELKAAVYNGDDAAFVDYMTLLTDHGVDQKQAEEEVRKFIHHFFDGKFTIGEQKFVTNITMTDEEAIRLLVKYGGWDEDYARGRLKKWK